MLTTISRTYSDCQSFLLCELFLCLEIAKTFVQFRENIFNSKEQSSQHRRKFSSQEKKHYNHEQNIMAIFPPHSMFTTDQKSLCKFFSFLTTLSKYKNFL